MPGKTRIASTSNRQHARGFTISSLMIGMAISVIITLGVLTIYVDTVSASSTTLKESRLNQDLRAALDIMSRDVRRAGYWSLAESDLGTDANTNPFMTNAMDVTVNAAGNCILFSYDLNDDGALNTATPDERFGYRFNSATQSLEMRSGAADCVSAGWETVLSNESLQITALVFTKADTVVDADGSIGGATLTLRDITISITAHPKNDPNFTRTQSEIVRVRNDRFVP